MSIRVHRFEDLAQNTISTLQSRLTEYYSRPPDTYYVISNQAAERYTQAIQPFHCDLVSRISRGMSLLEIGCGSAHLCPFVESRGGVYTGMDYSKELLDRNRERFPNARFLSIVSDPGETFDVVASLYTIEHVVDPGAYLHRIWQLCKVGGHIAVICPDFVDGVGLPPSFYYGKTPRRLREKVGSLAFIDALEHLFDLFWFAPRWKARARSTPPGAFWINLKPRILHGANYSIDADAVHLPRLRDLVWWLETHGASITVTSQSLPDTDNSILKYNCYVLARKPAE